MAEPHFLDAVKDYTANQINNNSPIKRDSVLRGIAPALRIKLLMGISNAPTSPSLGENYYVEKFDFHRLVIPYFSPSIPDAAKKAVANKMVSDLGDAGINANFNGNALLIDQSLNSPQLETAALTIKATLEKYLGPDLFKKPEYTAKEYVHLRKEAAANLVKELGHPIQSASADSILQEFTDSGINLQTEIGSTFQANGIHFSIKAELDGSLTIAPHVKRQGHGAEEQRQLESGDWSKDRGAAVAIGGDMNPGGLSGEDAEKARAVIAWLAHHMKEEGYHVTTPESFEAIPAYTGCEMKIARMNGRNLSVDLGQAIDSGQKQRWELPQEQETPAPNTGPVKLTRTLTPQQLDIKLLDEISTLLASHINDDKLRQSVVGQIMKLAVENRKAHAALSSPDTQQSRRAPG